MGRDVSGDADPTGATMLLQVPTADNFAGWRAQNYADQVALEWVEAKDGPTGERRGYLSATASRADGSVAVDVPAANLGQRTMGSLTGLTYVSEPNENYPNVPTVEQHLHYLDTAERTETVALSLSVWLRSPGQGQADAGVALWAIPEQVQAEQTYELGRVRLRERWERVEVVHGPFAAWHFARCEVYVQSTGRPVHLAGAVLV